MGNRTISVHQVKREADAGQSAAGSPKVTRYEDSVALLCCGVLLMGSAAFISYTAPDLGETLARSGMPMWAFVGLLALAGVAMVAVGGVKLLLGRIRQK